MFSPDEWQLIQEACEQRRRQLQDQSHRGNPLGQQEFCARRASALGELIARILDHRKILGHQQH